VNAVLEWTGLRGTGREGALRRQGILTFGASGSILLVNLATGVLVARSLGTDGRGELTAIMIVPQLVGWALSMGSLQAIPYRQARHSEDGGRLIATWLVMLSPFAVVAIVAAQLLLPVVFAAQTHEAYHLAQLYALSVWMWVIAGVVHAVLLGDHDFLFYNAMRIALPLATAIGYLVLWQADALSVGTALLINVVVGAVVDAVIAIRVLRRHPLRRPSLALARSSLWYGVRAHGTTVGGVMNARLDLFIIPAFLAASGVGLYAVASSVASTVVTLSAALSSIVLPAAARQGSAGARTVIRSLHATLAVAVVMAVGLAVFADVGIRLVYGSEFGHSAHALRLLLPGTVLYAAASVLWSGLYAVDRPFTAAVGQVAGLLVTGAGLLLFLERGGITAAALVTTTSYTVVFVVSLVLYRRATGLGWGAFLPGTGSHAGIARAPSPRRLEPAEALELSAHVGER
jgi:O-antigen/teichoic acid export membrane protein